MTRKPNQHSTPDRTPEMEAWVPAGFHDNLDSPAARLVVQALMDRGVPAPTWTTSSPISASTRRAYENRLDVWFTSVGLTEDEVLSLGHVQRCELVEAFLDEKAGTVATGTLDGYRAAIQWWADELDLDSPITDAAIAIQGRPGT